MKSSATRRSDGRSARQRILEKAHDLFYRDGIRATGIDRVIAGAGVTKVTFYRHFPSKSDLVLAFLELRHENWMRWFVAALERHRTRSRTGLHTVAPALAEWLGDGTYRGCAFINSVVEVGASLPGATAISRRHKQDMTAAIAALLPKAPGARRLAAAAAQAVDGAIVRAQIDGSPGAALGTLRWTLKALAGAQPQPGS